jgi:hypothetical protein
MRFKGETCSGGKLSKERITVLLCCNIDGSEKKRIDVIGKSVKPRSFGNKMKNLPINYYNNKKAWMTSELWLNIMSKLNKKMAKENRNILMFVDNCSEHSESLKLSNIKFVFSPPNTTACNQPLDGGVIKTFKGYYRKSMVKHLLSVINSGNQIESNTITLLDAVFMVHSAWDEINGTTIQNCFRKCRFNINSVENDIQVDDEFEAV